MGTCIFHAGLNTGKQAQRFSHSQHIIIVGSRVLLCVLCSSNGVLGGGGEWCLGKVEMLINLLFVVVDHPLLLLWGRTGGSTRTGGIPTHLNYPAHSHL